MTGLANAIMLLNAIAQQSYKVRWKQSIFTVVVGVALERFLKDHLVVAEQKYEGWRHELCYWSALTILITLAIRFLIGSYIHLHVTYVDAPTPKVLLRFLKDLFFLFAFGTFLVRAAIAKHFSSFMYWIMLFSAAGVAWSVIEVITRSYHLAWAWLLINLLQCVVTFVCWKYVGSRPDALRGIPAIFAVLVIMFAGLFCLDLWQIIIGSGLTELPRESLVDVLPGGPTARGQEQVSRTDVAVCSFRRLTELWRRGNACDSAQCSGAGSRVLLASWGSEALYNFDEDMAAEQRKKQLADPKLYPLSIPDYQSRVWDDFVDYQIAPFGRVHSLLASVITNWYHRRDAMSLSADSQTGL